MSEYICSTPSCAIALSKAAFPVSMNCPVCQQALTELIEKPLLSEEDEQLISNLPYVIAYPLKRTLLEKHAWTKINLLKDTFLNYLKYIGLIAASEFFNSPLKDKKMVALFQQALAEPSFGSWNQYIRETLSYLKENNHSFFCPDLLSYYDLIESGKKRKLFKGEIEIMDANGDIQIKKQEATAIGMLINFRNRYLGHGLTLDESDAVNHWEMYFPIFRELLVQLKFSAVYPMFKCEHGESYLLKSAEISLVEKGNQTSSRVWIENPEGNSMDILPFFVVPGEVSIGKEDKEQLLTYESYTGKTIKFFSPEGTEKQTSGKILEKLNLLLRDKQKETPFAPEAFTKDEFLKRIAEENKLLLDTLISEKKIIPGIYQHREEMEIKLREWIGARANIFFIVAEAGSGKTNLLVEMQKQYTERDLPSLLIRAGRMEKQSLKEQITYLLNIDLQQGLENYTSIAGTQSQPTFILIDGLNEANNAEEIWREIIDICKVFVPGSIKFVVTNRANTKSELRRYSLSEKDYNLLYGENKDNETELGAYTFWLTSLNMREMKGAWEGYIQNNKNNYKPQFLFDDLAVFDRTIYNLIGNPLVLRIFLETYHGKSLPKKGIKHLNIWQDWLETFSKAEISFLKLLAQVVWEKGKNELLMDDLLNHSSLKLYITTDLINAPYPRFKNLGWVSRFTKDLNSYLSFTVEGSLLYLLGIYLNEQEGSKVLNSITSLLDKGSMIQKSAVEAFLIQIALEGDFSLVCDLIDAGDKYHNSCNYPMLFYIRNYGVNLLIERVFSMPSENDWKAILMLIKTLKDVQENMLLKELMEKLMPLNTFNSTPALELGLKACSILDNKPAQEYLLEIDKYSELFRDDYLILENYGDVYYKFAQFDRALDFYQQCLNVELEIRARENPELASIYSKIGRVFSNKGQNDKALEYHQRCLEIELQTLGSDHPLLAGSYSSIAGVWNDNREYDKALEFYQKGLDINIKTLGEEHPYVSTSYNNIGLVWWNKGDHHKANDFYQKALDIKLKTLGDEHPNVASTLSNIGIILDSKGEHDEALEFYQKALNIELKTLGEEHPNVASSFANIGTIWHRKGEYDKAIEYYEKCLNIVLKTFGEEHHDLATTYNNIAVSWSCKGNNVKTLEYYEKNLAITLKTFGGEHPSVALSYNNLGVVWENIGNYEKALEYHEKSLKIRLKTLGEGHPDVASSYNNIGDTWGRKGNIDTALNYYDKCLEIRLKSLGENHPDCATSYNNIGVVWDGKGEYDKAIEYYEKCLNIEIKNLGAENPSIASICIDIGFALENKGDYIKAIKFYQQSKDVNIIVFGKEHTSVSLNYFYIGRCFKSLSEYKDAIKAFKNGYKYYRKGGFPFNMAECYEKLGDGIKAFAFFLESAELRKSDPEIGIDAEATIDTVKNVVRLATELERMEDVPDWIKELRLG